MNRLSYNLFSKRTLRFGVNGNFKIAVFTDLQEPLDYDVRTLNGIDAVIGREKPDLVILGGDICSPESVRTKDDLKRYLDVFSAPMESRNIPWAHIFGNHDHDLSVSESAAQKIYESYPFCVSKHTEPRIHGTTNFVLPVYSSESDGKIRFNVWCVDTNNRIDDLKHGLAREAVKYRDRFCETPADYDIVRFDQLMWYWNSSAELERYNGAKINALMVMHTGLYETILVSKNPEASGLTDTADELLDPGAFNSGLFAAVLQRGDVRHITCGHTHKNDFSGDYCGIGLSFCGSMGYSAYGPAERKGGRIFEINEKDTSVISTRMVYAKSLRSL